tara:strand:+ start:1977 stop:4187 length:2211 start_codon:yes stop_codon:yes gene_type:complete
MATFFQTPGSGQLSQEELDFKGLDYDYTKKLTPEEGYENIKNFVAPIMQNLQETGESVQYNNIVNMSGIDVPSFDQIQTMNYDQLMNLKKDIEAKQKTASSNSFSSAYAIALQQIEKSLLNMEGSEPNVVSSANDVMTDQNTITNAENNVIQASTAEAIDNEIQSAINMFDVAAEESNKITTGAGYNDVESVEQVNVIADGSLVNNKGGTDVIVKEEFEKGKGELNLEKNASNTEVTEEDEQSAIAKIKEELKQVLPEEEIPTDLLLLKFGANLLRARSNRRGALPKFLDELGQSLAPITDTLIAYDLKKKEADRALALQAYEIYEDQATRGAKRYEFEDLYNVYAADYDQKGGGILKGGTTLVGQITTPAEMDYYKAMRYPDEASVEIGIHTQEQLDNTPGHLQGLPMFVMTKTTGAKQDFGSPVFGGYGSGDKTAIRSAFEFGGMLESGLRNDVKLYAMIARGLEEGNKPLAGPGARIARWTQVTAGKLNTIARTFGVDSGIPMLNRLAGEDDYQKFYSSMKAAGIDLQPGAIKASIADDVKMLYQNNDAMLDNEMLSNEEWEFNNKQIKLLDQISKDIQQRDDYNIVVSLMQKSAFTRARYLQGTNRLLKDVIEEARKIMDVLNKSEREALSILGENIQNYTRKYNEQLQIIYDPQTQAEEYNKRQIFVDKNYNVIGGMGNTNPSNISSDSLLGSQINLDDVNVSQDLGGQMEFQSLEDQLNEFNIEMPVELK